MITQITEKRLVEIEHELRRVCQAYDCSAGAAHPEAERVLGELFVWVEKLGEALNLLRSVDKFYSTDVNVEEWLAEIDFEVGYD